MIITFFGHASFIENEKYEQKVLDFLEERIGDRVAYAYLGKHGKFDDFAYECCRKYKVKHPNLSLVYVTPYMTLEFQKKHLSEQLRHYDQVIYPEIEDKPIRFAIIYRNRYMVESADFVLTYVSHRWGGAYKAFEYAKKKGKPIFNIAESL